jgi:hypothetical protein
VSIVDTGQASNVDIGSDVIVDIESDVDRHEHRNVCALPMPVSLQFLRCWPLSPSKRTLFIACAVVAHNL